MKFNIKIVSMLCAILCSYIVWAQEDIDVDDLEGLFEDVAQDDSDTTSENVADEDAFGFDSIQASENNVLEISGSHSFIYPFLYSTFLEGSDYFNYDEYPRAPQHRSILKMEYNSSTISGVTEVDIGVYGTSIDDIQEIVQVTLGEAYISAHFSFIDIIAGFKKYSWGTALGFNPTDNLNPSDYRNGTIPDKISLLSLAMKVYPMSIMSLEMVLAPIYQPFRYSFVEDELSLLETNMNRNSLSNQSTGAVTTTISTEDSTPLSQVQIGGKLNLFLSFADISFSYLYDVDDFYSIDTRVRSSPPSIENNLGLLRRNIHRFGFDIIGSIQSVGVWAEVAANIAEELQASEYSKIRNHNISWTVGTDFSFGNKNTLDILLQQFGTYIFDYPTSAVATDVESQNEQINYSLAQQTEGLRLGGMADVTLSLLSDRIIPSLRAVYFYPLLYDDSNTTRFGTLMMIPSFEVVPFDSFSITVGTEFAYAWEDDYHINEQSTRNNRMFIEIAYEWSWR